MTIRSPPKINGRRYADANDTRKGRRLLIFSALHIAADGERKFNRLSTAMFILNRIGLVGVVSVGLVLWMFVYVWGKLGYSTNDGMFDLLLGIGYCFLTSVYAFTFDRCDEQGVGTFHLNCKNAYYSFWADRGADWAADPRRTGIVLHPGRRLCLFVWPLAINIFFPLPISAFLWIRDSVVEQPWATNSQHAVVFVVSLVALVIALVYARMTRKWRLIPPWPRSPW